MAGSHSDDGDPGFQIAPMVDVVFVLLLFFMASAGSRLIEKDLVVILPSNHIGPSYLVLDPPIIINIQSDGSVTSSGRLFDSPTSRELPALKEWLADTINRFGNESPVIIKPDPEATHERIIDVLNSAAGAKVKKLTFG